MLWGMNASIVHKDQQQLNMIKYTIQQYTIPQISSDSIRNKFKDAIEWNDLNIDLLSKPPQPPPSIFSSLFIMEKISKGVQPKIGFLQHSPILNDYENKFNTELSKDDCHISIRIMCILKRIDDLKSMTKQNADPSPIPQWPPPRLSSSLSH